MDQHKAEQSQAGNTGDLNLQLTYRGIISRIAEAAGPDGYQRVRDLPELSHADLAAIVRHYPGIFMDAMAEHDSSLREVLPTILEQSCSQLDRYHLVSLHLIGALQAYVLPLVLRDVQIQCERLREADSIEAGSDRRDVLTAEQLMACELGVGRLLS